MNIEPKIQTSKGTFHNARDFAAIKEKLLGSEGWDVSLATLKKRAMSAWKQGDWDQGFEDVIM